MKLAHLEASFPWGVLLITDRDATDPIPSWASPEDQVTATDSAAVVRVRHSDEGPVRVQVWDGDERVAGALAFEGDISVPSGVLKVSDALGDESVSIEAAGRTGRLRVYVDAAVEASSIDLVLTPLPDVP